jgi:uncharacterized membrane protein YoaK (UPF0700 family)
MFRHKGKGRTYEHNLRLAALLSFIAGMVNITGVLNVKTLTTNVTGHFAFFAEELVKQENAIALTFLIYIFSFLAGAFFSSLLTEYGISKQVRSAHAPAMIAEILILLLVGLRVEVLSKITMSNTIIASLLLIAMGMQNALVTKISNSIVRTTHLTGLFTDLGIEISQLFFYRKEEQRFSLSRSIKLRIAIITFFFLGCVLGGFLYFLLLARTLIVASFLLTIALAYDNIRLKYYQYVRKNEPKRRRRFRRERIKAYRQRLQ